MGIYVNPIEGTKEDWLSIFAESLKELPSWKDIQKGFLPVCLIDNRIFTAAAVAYDEDEYTVLRNVAADDDRPRTWFMAKENDLVEVSDLANFIKYRNSIGQKDASPEAT